MSPYEVLGVPHNADERQIRRAYLAKARDAHPDRPGGSDDEMRTVNEAWEVLSDPARRAGYDLGVRRARRAAEGKRQRQTASSKAASNTSASNKASSDRAEADATRQRTKKSARSEPDPSRVYRQQSAAEKAAPPTLRALLPLALLVVGGLIVLVGAAAQFSPLIAFGAIAIGLGVLSFIVLPMLSLSESRRADGPQ